MAGGQEFKQGMQKASKPRGGNAGGPQLIGAGAWDTQVQRESQQFNNAAISGSRGAENIAAYANVSKSATQANGEFSYNNANKFVNSSRDQSNTNKAQNAGFSDNRVSNNVDFANNQRGNNMAENEGFAMKTTNNFINNAKDHREDNTAKASAFADKTVNKYIEKNKGNQSVNVQALDKQVRQAPIVDQAYSTVQGNNTFGDMYSYGRKELPGWAMPDPMKGVKTPAFDDMYDKTKDDLDEYKV